MSRSITDTITLYERKDWKARPPRGKMDRHGNPTEAFIHHTTDRVAENLDTLAEQMEAVRAVQAFHMFVNGWSDGGYHYIVMQPYGNRKHARIFELREDKFSPAAQQDHNAGTLAIAIFGNFDRDDDVFRNTRWAVAKLLAEYPSLKTLGGHRDVVATECPGDTLYRQIPRIARTAGLRVFRA